MEVERKARGERISLTELTTKEEEQPKATFAETRFTTTEESVSKI